jgi:hypothetical protein
MLVALVSAQIPGLNIIQFLGQKHINFKLFMNTTISQWEKERKLVPLLDELEIVNHEVVGFEKLQAGELLQITFPRGPWMWGLELISMLVSHVGKGMSSATKKSRNAIDV